MSYNSNDLFVARNSRSGYEIEQSLRFDGSSYLTRTNGAGGNLRTFTQSFWVKAMSNTTSSMVVFEAFNGAWTDWSTTAFGGSSSPGILVQNRVSGTTYGINSANSNIYYRDPGAWRHVVVSVNNAVPTMYVNGSQLSLTNNNSSDWYFLKNGLGLRIGSRNADYTEILNGYLAEIHYIDGQALDHEDFGEFDDNGVWRPIEYTGSHGTQGFYLKFDPSATNGIGHDHSGNGNNFTPTGFTTSGTGTDVMSDTPTNNFATLIPINPNYGYQTTTPVDGNLKATFYPVLSPSSNPGAPALTNFKIPTTGKWYYEFTVSGSNNYSWGVAARNDGQELYNFTLSNRAFWGWYHIYQPGYPSNGNGSQIYSPGTGSASGGGSLSSGDVIGMAINFDNNSLTITRNGSSYATITSCNFSSFDYVLPQWGTATNGISGSAILLNAGQRAFEYTVPTDHQSLCTANLPAPDIADGSQYFNTVLYTGDGASSRSITGVGFQPDFVWLKRRNGAGDHSQYDAVRGATKLLQSSQTNAEQTLANGLTSFDVSGFGVGTYENANSVTYAGWCWDAGGTGSSNTAGSITSTVSANPTAGFSIATYTGNGTAGATIGHGLGVAPSFIVTKRRDNTSVWNVYHASLGATKVLYLNQNSPQQTDSSVWNNTAPSSTVFTVGTDSNINTNTGTYIAYCFAEIESYSKFGIYTGNGSTDGPFVALNFRPAWVLIKQTYPDGNWYLLDSTRASYNPAEPQLIADSAAAETSYTGWGDLLSNGFKVRRTDSAWNGVYSTYIYAAFAENPFGGSNVSPATAR